MDDFFVPSLSRSALCLSNFYREIGRHPVYYAWVDGRSSI